MKNRHQITCIHMCICSQTHIYAKIHKQGHRPIPCTHRNTHVHTYSTTDRHTNIQASHTHRYTPSQIQTHTYLWIHRTTHTHTDYIDTYELQAHRNTCRVTLIWTHTNMHIHTQYIHSHTNMHIYTYTNWNTLVHLKTCTHIHIFTFTCTWSSHISILKVYTNMHTHIHKYIM